MWNGCVILMAKKETRAVTHVLRDARENSGYVKFGGKPTSRLLEDGNVAALHTARSWRNRMQERDLDVCMLIHEYGPRKTSRQIYRHNMRAVVCKV